MKQVEAAGKKIDDAIKAGLAELGVSLSEVNVEILDQGGFFRKAKVRLTLIEEDVKPVKAQPAAKANESAAAAAKKQNQAADAEDKKFKPAPVKKESKPSSDTRPEPLKPVAGGESREKEARKVSDAQVALAKDYLSKLLGLMKIEAEIVVDTSHGSIDVDLVSEDSAVIGHRGEVLDALQILTKRAVEEGEDKFVHVNVDSRNYRVKREQSLVSLANKMAAKCVRTGRKVVLEPMNNTHRKIIHATLSANDKVITKSEGREPNRKVVIIPKRY